MKIGESGKARADIDAAMADAQQIQNVPLRTRTIADVTLASAHIALQSAPTEAEPALRRVVDAYLGGLK